MASKTEICNLAISHIGISKEIANIETEKSAEAAACRRFYAPAREEAFRDFGHPFATKFVALALIESTPNTDWDYSYRYPSDCERPTKIVGAARNDSRQSRISYIVASDSAGRIIYTDEQNAVLKYTSLITDETVYPQDVVMMLSLLIASYIAARLTRGDPFKMGERAFNLYLRSRAKAEANAFNEQQDDEVVNSEFIRDRE